MSAIKSLTAMGRKLGVCNYTLEDIKGEKVESYRDTTGIAATDFAKVLGLVDRTKLKVNGIMPYCGCCGTMRCGGVKSAT